MSVATIRRAEPADACALADIYRPVVESTTISFEEVAPDGAEFEQRIRDVGTAYPWLVAEREGMIAGYAYGHRHRERAGYRFSVEVSVYVNERARGYGVGRALYEALLCELRARGFHRAFAGIALPNDASVVLHERCGFARIGVFPEVGYKFGRWIDVAWYQRLLRG